MQHLVLTRYGKAADSLQLVDGPDPVPGPHDVLVRIEAAAINPSDFMLIEGTYFIRPELPATAGAEGVGVVETVGIEVDNSIVGRRVIVLPTSVYGTWSQKVVVAEADVFEVPQDVDPLQLAMLSINPVTAHLMLERGTGIEIGDWVGQTAANSAVGLHVVALAKRRGLKTLNVVRRDEAANDVRRAGGDVVLVSGPNLADDIARELGDEKLSLVLDALGGGPVVSDLIGAMKFGGTCVTYGTLTETPSGTSPTDLFVREVRHTGFWLGNWYNRAPRREIVSTLAYLSQLLGDGDLSAPIEATYRLDHYLEAFEHAQSYQRGGKVVFTFE